MSFIPDSRSLIRHRTFQGSSVRSTSCLQLSSANEGPGDPIYYVCCCCGWLKFQDQIRGGGCPHGKYHVDIVNIVITLVCQQVTAHYRPAENRLHDQSIDACAYCVGLEHPAFPTAQNVPTRARGIVYHIRGSESCQIVDLLIRSRTPASETVHAYGLPKKLGTGRVLCKR